MDDLELLQQFAKTKSEEAFATLVSRHVNMVYSVALRRTGNPDAAQEITQAVFIVLAKKASSLGKTTVLAAWLFEAVRLTAAHYHRDEARRILREQEACMHFLSDEPEPNVWSQLAPFLEDAINELGDKDRKAIIIRFLQDKPLAEVGQVLGISEDAAQKRVTRALERMRTRLLHRGITVSTIALGGTLAANSVQAAPVGLASVATAAALSKTAAAAPSILALSKGAINLMAWTKLKTSAAVGLAVILAGSSSMLLWQEAAQAGAQHNYDATLVVRTSTGSTNATVATRTPTNAPAFRWENIESTDYRQYVANLRAAGFPEPMVRDIVLADLHQLYSRKAKALDGGASPAPPYWQKRKPSPDLTRKQQNDLQTLTKEEAAVAASILGYKVNTKNAFDSLLLGFNDFAPKVAWLPPEKRDAARKIFEESDLDLFSRANFERSVALLAPILTPEELEEYRLRESPQAEQLRHDSQFANLTPDEFKAIAKVRQSINDEQDQTIDKLQKEIEGLAQLLGPERAKELAKKCDRTACWASLVAERYGISSQSIDQAVQLKWDTMDASARLWADTTLTDADRQQKQAALKRAVEAALLRFLGSNGAEWAKRNDSIWLRNITQRP